MFVARALVILSLFIYPAVCTAKLSVFACEPEWAALAVSIGGDQVDVYSATNHAQNPHFIQARPSLIAKARQADLLICSGAGLEAGWLPLLLRKSGNKKIQPGANGYFMAASQVELLEKPLLIDRSQGDLHAAGNPHVHLNPAHMLSVGQALSSRLSLLDPASKLKYAASYESLENSFAAMLADYASTIGDLRGAKVVVHHNSWVYLAEWLGLDQVATLEPRPGVPPNSKQLSKLLDQLTSSGFNFIIRANYQNSRASDWLSSRVHAPVVTIQYSPAEWQMKDALITWYKQMLQELNQQDGGS